MIKPFTLLFTSIFILGGVAASATNSNAIPKNGYVMPKGVKASDYVEKTVVFKVQPQLANQCSANAILDADIISALSEIGVLELKKLFPFAQKPERLHNNLGQSYADLTLIYTVKYTAAIGVDEAANKLIKTNKVVYAEPKFIHKLELAINDPSAASQQTFLAKINAYNAWNTSTGDTNVVIGIVDSGTDIDHPDLVANLKLNYNDPINGIDDDNDGYVDNFRGWDMSENDNNPNVDNSTHGSHVSGCAAASTNNGIGVASPGFNCKFLPVKCAAQASTTSIDNGYEGITYAADHGCQIINCSWGGGFSSQMGQDVITYATINKNALVIAAAGNDNVDGAFFPAAFQYVTSVAATTIADKKASFSNYNYTVDISSPGNNIYSTVSNNTYTTMSGTSMASPIAAGAAGIIKSVFPNYSALQVAEQLRVTCDDIYSILPNNNYMGQLGKGRINMGNSVTQSMPSVRMEPINFTDGNDDAFVAGDTVKISGDFLNYLAPTANCNVVLTAQTNGTSVNIIASNFNIGALGTLSSTNNNNVPFKVVINQSAPANTVVLFRLSYTDGTTYTDFQAFEIIVNVDYINVTINDVYTTITSKGRSCYNGDGETQGLGFVYRDSSLAYECGLMIGTSTTKVVNTVRNAGATPDNDFASMARVSLDNPTVISDFDLTGKFNDANAIAAAKLNIEVSHRSFTWNAPGDMNYVMVQYRIKNTSGATLNNLYAGIFTDWDIQNYANNRSAQNAALKLGYAFATTSTQLYAGVKVLSNTPFNMYAADNVTGGGGGINLADGFATDEKYQTLSTSRPQAGANGAGNDVINIVSTGPFTVLNGDSIVVAFALIGGEDLAELETGAANAQIRYDAAFPVTVTANNNANLTETNFKAFPNPANENLSVNLNLINTSKVNLSIYDATGRMVKNLLAKDVQSGNNTFNFLIADLQAGIYTCTMITAEKTMTQRITIVK